MDLVNVYDAVVPSIVALIARMVRRPVGEQLVAGRCAFGFQSFQAPREILAGHVITLASHVRRAMRAAGPLTCPTSTGATYSPRSLSLLECAGLSPRCPRSRAVSTRLLAALPVYVPGCEAQAFEGAYADLKCSIPSTATRSAGRRSMLRRTPVDPVALPSPPSLSRATRSAKRRQPPARGWLRAPRGPS